MPTVRQYVDELVRVIVARSISEVGLIVRRFSGATTADVQQWLDEAGVLLASVAKDGAIYTARGQWNSKVNFNQVEFLVTGGDATTIFKVYNIGAGVSHFESSAQRMSMPGAGYTNGTSVVPLSVRGRLAVVGAPASGTWTAGDVVVDSVGRMFICTASGTPGTWIGDATDTQVFTAGGTWTKPSGAQSVTVVCVGGGGGGGGGRRDAAATVRAGGGGGGGGGYSTSLFRVADLGATEAVTVGGAGSAGTASTVNATSGGNGGNGGDSTFSGVRAIGGTGGVGGGTGAAAGGTGGGGTMAGNAGAASSATGAAGSSSTPASGSGSPGGASGGGVTTANAQAAGGAGTRNLAANTAVAVGAAGAAGSGNGGAGSTTPGPGVGTSGGGGGSSASVAGGNGGNGGNYGAGGGGGGASFTGFNSGTGGAGAPGVVIVITYY